MSDRFPDPQQREHLSVIANGLQVAALLAASLVEATTSQLDDLHRMSAALDSARLACVALHPSTDQGRQ